MSRTLRRLQVVHKRGHIGRKTDLGSCREDEQVPHSIIICSAVAATCVAQAVAGLGRCFEYQPSIASTEALFVSVNNGDLKPIYPCRLTKVTNADPLRCCLRPGTRFGQYLLRLDVVTKRRCSAFWSGGEEPEGGGGDEYLQSLSTFDLGIELGKVGIGQYDLVLKHHDAFDDRDETTGIFKVAAFLLSAYYHTILNFRGN